jgi:O-antigen/teichoic acid export membrane protein
MEREANRVIRLCLYVALPVGVGGMILAKPVVRMLYGEAYAPAADALAVLIWSIVCLLLNLICLIVLYASGRQSTVMKITGTAVGMNILLNLFLIPAWGIVGAAAATATTDLLSLVSLLCLTRPNLSRRLLEILPKPLLCVVLMGIALWWLRDMPIFVNVPLSAILYTAGLLLSGALTFEELSRLKHAFTGRP